MKRLQFPLLILSLFASSIIVAQVQTNVASNSPTQKGFSCQVTVRDLAKEDTYSATTNDHTQNEWSLIRINGDEPSKTDHSRFRKITGDYQPVYKALSGNSMPSSITVNGKKFQAQLVEKNNLNKLVKATYVTKGANSTKHKLEVFYSSFDASTSLIEKIECKVVNTRNNSEETEMVLSYYNYR